MTFAHVVVLISEERPPRAHIFGVPGIEPRRQREWREAFERQGVELVVRFATIGNDAQWVRMVVDRFDLCDLGDKLRTGGSLSASERLRV
jgi:hypothetical protein